MRTTMLLWACLAIIGGCASSRQEVTGFLSWGTMRDVLREGRTEGRVVLADVLQPGTIGVGVLEGLAAEVTIDGGTLHLAAVEDGQPVARPARPNDRATLLAVAHVRHWTHHELPAIADTEDLEDAIRVAAIEDGIDPSAGPIAVRIEAPLRGIAIHVLAGSCPVANPDGPPPWRFVGTDLDGVVVGFYVEGQPGVLTHHGQRSHLHAIVRTEGCERSGHLESIALDAGTRLSIGR